MRVRGATLLAATAALAAAFCRKVEAPRIDPVRAIRERVRLRFSPPANGLLTDAEIDAFVRVRKASGRRPPADVAEEMDVDPAEFSWVRARIGDALMALDAQRATDAAAGSYAEALATLRETRRTTRDARAASRIDAEIAALERERSGLRRPISAAPAGRNAARIAPRRAELEQLGP